MVSLPGPPPNDAPSPIRSLPTENPKAIVLMDFVSQEHGVPCDGAKDANAGG
jgi:hypothetical protein